MRRTTWLLPLLLACTQGSTDPEIENALSGSWSWVQSRGGFAYMERSPRTEGYTVRLDYEGTRVRAYRDDRLIAEARFTIREDSLRAGPLPVYIVEYSPALTVFRFSTLDRHTARLTGKLIFEFDEGCCDRYSHTFTKPGIR